MQFQRRTDWWKTERALDNKDTLLSVLVLHVKVRKGEGSEGRKIMSDSLPLLKFFNKYWRLWLVGICMVVRMNTVC